MESGLRILKNELAGLETMLDDAIYFRNETYKNLVLTEKEASENRKRRRIQMAKMKKAVEKILEENQRAPAKQHQAKIRTDVSSTVLNPGQMGGEVSDILRYKRAEVEEYQGRARRLVEIMRVPDLTHIPLRLRTVATIGVRLREELNGKQRLRDLFLKQKAQLQLILYYFRYTGVAQLETFNGNKTEYENSIEEAQKKHVLMMHRMDRIGDVQVRLRLGMLSILDQLTEGKKKTAHRTHEDMRQNMKLISNKLQKIVDGNAELEALFDGTYPEKNYTAYVKQPSHQNRLIRVGTPHVSEESDEDDDLVDSKVPGRQEIKSKSARIVNQANLKRGIR
ncbi:uncharacterized protein LOC110853448 isoform X2 [Folsomia candida]|nr:uncharacterized protein LOC110853448 isoform X2 [Folsomia candida]XP_035710499.1 uncharacterized protein LOC110853448 isoform X2 [Folsomia candida]